MRYIPIGIIALALAGCQTGAMSKIDVAIQKNLPKICTGAASIHSAFMVIAATGTVPSRAVRNERVAFAGVMQVCNDPASVSSATAMVTAANAYAAMIAALREAE